MDRVHGGSRELRYFRRKFLTAGAILALILVVGFVSERIGSVPWPSFSTNVPPTLSAIDDVLGRASVVDGDTLEIQGQHIRLWGAMHPRARSNVTLTDNHGAAASKLPYRSPITSDSRRSHASRNRDRYGRIVAQCSITAQEIGEWLVRNGWALDYSNYSGGHYSSQQASAASARLGIWRGQFDNPWEWQRTNW